MMDRGDASQLIRLPNTLIGGGTVFVGGLLGGAEVTTDWVTVSLHSLSVIAFMGCWNIFNDIMDIDVDRNNRPDRPLPSGRVSIDEARSFATGLLTLSVIGLLGAAGWVSINEMDLAAWLPSLPIWFAALLLMVHYEFEGGNSLRLKHKGLPGNIAVSLLVGIVIIFGAASVGGLSNPLVWMVGLTAFCINSAREIIKDVEDMEGDVGRETLSMQIGPNKARTIAWIMTLLGFASLFLPFGIDVLPSGMLLLLTPAILAILAAKPRIHQGDDHGAQRMLRLAILLGMIGFAVAAIIENG